MPKDSNLPKTPRTSAAMRGAMSPPLPPECAKPWCRLQARPESFFCELHT